MNKILITIILIIVIPYIVVNKFIKDDTIDFKYISNNYVRIKRESKGIIEEVPLEEYVKGVLAGEMPASFELEALKAQAVAARTYVLKKIDQTKNYDVTDSIKNQVYLDDEKLKINWKNNYKKNMNKIKQAVIETKGEYLSYNDKIISAFFFSTSNGKTENCEDVFVEKLPYLKSVESPWDREISPSYSNTKEYSLTEFYKKLNIEYKEKLEIDIIDRTKSGSVKTIIINNNRFKGTIVRKKLSLNSTYFEIIQEKNKIIIKTKGNGHGVGMSQYGAQGMAKKGYKYNDILSYYYKDIEIKKI